MAVRNAGGGRWPGELPETPAASSGDIAMLSDATGAMPPPRDADGEGTPLPPPVVDALTLLEVECCLGGFGKFMAAAADAAASELANTDVLKRDLEGFELPEAAARPRPGVTAERRDALLLEVDVAPFAGREEYGIAERVFVVREGLCSSSDMATSESWLPDEAWTARRVLDVPVEDDEVDADEAAASSCCSAMVRPWRPENVNCDRWLTPAC